MSGAERRIRELLQDSARPQVKPTLEQWNDPVVRAAYATAYRHALEECIEIMEEEEE